MLAKAAKQTNLLNLQPLVTYLAMAAKKLATASKIKRTRYIY